MSFDWGGFTGSVVGVIGAYAIAVYQLRKQEKAQEPIKHKKTYELCIKLSQQLNSVWSLFGTENFQYSEASKNVVQFNNQLQNYLSEAIETDKRLVNIINQTIGGLSDISKKYYAKPKDHNNYIAYEYEVIFFAEVVRQECHEIRDEIMRLYAGDL
jgi:DNA repair ATPase RecN